MKILYKLKHNLDSLYQITNSNFLLLEEVSSWTNDLTSLREIKQQKYQILTLVHIAEEIDKVEDWIDSIRDSTSVMMTLYDQIQEVENRAKAQILEVDKFYSVDSMDIFIVNLMEELASTDTLVQYFKSSFEGLKDHMY